MTPTLTLFRALSRFYISRITRIATFVVLSVALVLLLGVWLLAHFFSPWWWLLATLIIGLLVGFFILRFIVLIVARLVYPDKVSSEQIKGIEAFIDKINRLLELKNINPVIIGFLSLKDFVLYRELRTLKSMIEDSTTLSGDFKKLNDQFK